MIALVLHLLAQLVAGWLAAFSHPAPAPVLPHPAPVEAPAPAAPPVLAPPAPVEAPASPVPPAQPPVADDSGVGQLLCLPGEEWDGIRCVALQLPGETDGRAYG